MKFMFDTNILDKIYENKDIMDNLLELVEKKKISLYITHIQIDEIQNIKDLCKRNFCNNLIEKLFFEISTFGAVCDVARCDCALIGGENEIELICSGNLKKSNDALIGSTVYQVGEIDYLVTEDKQFSRSMKNKLQFKNIIKFDEFKILLGNKY